MLSNIFEVERSEDCKRVRWQVLNWNKNAIQMYDKYGAEIDDERLNRSFDLDSIKNFRL